MLPIEPSPSPSSDTAPLEIWDASPGLQGFLYGFFVLGIALALLMWSMTRHLRKLRHLAEQERAERDARRSSWEASAGKQAGEKPAPAPDEADCPEEEPRDGTDHPAR